MTPSSLLPYPSPTTSEGSISTHLPLLPSLPLPTMQSWTHPTRPFVIPLTTYHKMSPYTNSSVHSFSLTFSYHVSKILSACCPLGDVWKISNIKKWHFFRFVILEAKIFFLHCSLLPSSCVHGNVVNFLILCLFFTQSTPSGLHSTNYRILTLLVDCNAHPSTSNLSRRSRINSWLSSNVPLTCCGITPERRESAGYGH